MPEPPAIVQPGTAPWQRAWIDQHITPTRVVVGLALILVMCAGIGLIVGGALPLKILGAFIVAALAGFTGYGAVGGMRRSVGPPVWECKGTPIVGEARALLADAAERAGEAKAFVYEIPTKLDWTQFQPHVDGLLWDAAEHAAEVSKLNVELKRYRYAEAHTAQGAVRDEFLQRRAEHLAVVENARNEMHALAAAAGNAAAAARVALQRTASVDDLEVVSPSAARLIAEGGLDEAKIQLEALGEAWAELDTSTRGLSAALERDIATGKASPGPRARRSPPPTDRQQEG